MRRQGHSSGVIPEHWSRSACSIQKTPDDLALGSVSCDIFLAETPEGHVEHPRRRLFPDAQEIRYRTACFVWITSISDGLHYVCATLGGQVVSVQKNEPPPHQLLFTRRLTNVRHDAEPSQVQGSFRNTGPGHSPIT